MQDLMAAVAIALIFEGILPFANPRGWRKMVASMAQLADKQLRLTGLVIMLIGLILLHIVRG